MRAEFIQPVAVQASNGQATQDALINGQGFDDPGVGTPASIHNQAGSEMWSGVGSIREYVIFDLGTNVSLTKVYIWNYNVVDATDVGMKDVEVQVSSDSDIANTNANFNTIATISLKEGGQTAQVFDVVGTDVRLVKLRASRIGGKAIPWAWPRCGSKAATSPATCRSSFSIALAGGPNCLWHGHHPHAKVNGQG